MEKRGKLARLTSMIRLLNGRGTARTIAVLRANCVGAGVGAGTSRGRYVSPLIRSKNDA